MNNTKNDAMQQELDAHIAALHAADDETKDGKIDIADMKLQLDRVEALLALEDTQNRALLRNQKIRFWVTGILVLALCLAVGVMWHQTNVAYQNVLEASTQVNALANTLQESLDQLDTGELTRLMKTMPEVMDKLSAIDVDSLNDVLTRLPALMDNVAALQSQFNAFTSQFSGITGLLGAIGGNAG
ncbi:MAG: hypothetical protein PHO10_10340 [Gemmiger sp.]|nr:hypothetical protein [Gemmiger sp.]